MKVKDKSGESNQKLLSFAEKHKNITWFFKTLGNYDYEISVEVENQQKYQEVLKEIRSQFSSVIDEVETIIRFDELKEDYAMILEEI